jgi:hypothetical protein
LKIRGHNDSPLVVETELFSLPSFYASHDVSPTDFRVPSKFSLRAVLRFQTSLPDAATFSEDAGLSVGQRGDLLQACDVFGSIAHAFSFGTKFISAIRFCASIIPTPRNFSMGSSRPP